MKTSQLHADVENASHLWDRIRKVEYDNEQAATRIARLEDVLLDCREYLEGQADIVDGYHGPRPNRAMELTSMIGQVLEPRG